MTAWEAVWKGADVTVRPDPQTGDTHLLSNGDNKVGTPSSVDRARIKEAMVQVHRGLNIRVAPDSLDLSKEN